METKSKNKRVEICLMVVTACLVMAGLWAVLATPETALAKKPPPEEAVLFDVTSTGAMEIVGTAEGRCDGVGGTKVVVNRPPVVMQMDFLNVVDDDMDGGAFGTDPYSGTLVIQERSAVFFFKALGKTGDKLMGYRIDADAEITTGLNFPTGEPVSGGYTVALTNIELSVDTGSRKNGYEGSFPGAEATVTLVRTTL